MRRVLFSLLTAASLVCAVPAQAAVSSALVGILSQQNSGDGSLADVIASAVFDLDATQSASYSGSGTTWANLVTAPADGSAQTAYDFYLGATSGAEASDPTFTGSAGDPAAYFSTDGADFFTKASAITTFLAQLQHYPSTGKGFWFATAGSFVTPGTNVSIFATSDASTNGCLFWITSAGNLSWRLRNGGGGATAATGVSIGGGTNKAAVFSYNNETGAWRVWINSNTASATGTSTFAAAGSSSDVPRIMSETDGGGLLPSGTKIYSLAMGNEYLDDAKAAAIIAALEARHGRDYTP